jgi:hypothetical protein
MAEHGVTHREHLLAKDAAIGVQQRKRRVVADCTDIAEVVGHPLELSHDPADDLRTQRHHDIARRFKCESERKLNATVESPDVRATMRAARSASELINRPSMPVCT